jgi:hypothetical protein
MSQKHLFLKIITAWLVVKIPFKSNIPEFDKLLRFAGPKKKTGVQKGPFSVFSNLPDQ